MMVRPEVERRQWGDGPGEDVGRGRGQRLPLEQALQGGVRVQGRVTVAAVCAVLAVGRREVVRLCAGGGWKTHGRGVPTTRTFDRRRRRWGWRRSRGVRVTAPATWGNDALDGERFGLVVARAGRREHRGRRGWRQERQFLRCSLGHGRRRGQRLFAGRCAAGRRAPHRVAHCWQWRRRVGRVRRRPAKRGLQQSPVSGRQFEPFAAPQERTVFEHVQGGRV